MYEDDESEDDELSEQTFEDEYEDAEGENLAPSTSERLALKDFLCPYCQKRVKEIARLVPPLCPRCGSEMRPAKGSPSEAYEHAKQGMAKARGKVGAKGKGAPAAKKTKTVKTKTKTKPAAKKAAGKKKR